MFFNPTRRRVSIDCGDRMVTKQSHKDECDIHRILKQYSRTGVYSHVNMAKASFGDLPDEIDYQAAQNTLLAADSAFSRLPASVRDYFSNDPGRFLAAFTNPAQEAYLRSVGLLNAKPATPPPLEAEKGS